jgi:hypothetical protein
MDKVPPSLNFVYKVSQIAYAKLQLDNSHHVTCNYYKPLLLSLWVDGGSLRGWSSTRRQTRHDC